MRPYKRCFVHRVMSAVLGGAVLWLGCASLLAQNQLAVTASPEKHRLLAGTTSPKTTRALDVGRVSGNESISGMTLLLKQTPAQAAFLHQLLAEQQTIGNEHYHQWLNPEDYSKFFGLDASGVSALEAWLTSKGFSHFVLNATHTTLSFDGSSGQVENAFSTEIHRYTTDDRAVLANAVDLRVPSSLSPLIDGVLNLSQFRPPPQHASSSAPTALPAWTSTVTGKHFLTPADIAQIYNISPVYAAGFTGQGQHIVVVGQSSVDLHDIARFRIASHLGTHQPSLLLVPNTGTPTNRAGDEAEADIDLEYAGATAPDADVTLVYTGSNPGYTVFDALAYAVGHNLAPVISVSYGECETSLSGSELTFLERVLMEANSQGETVIVSSGDQGATGCETSASQASGQASYGLGVQYPASSQYVTAVGGTMLQDTGLSWAASNAPDGESAKSYIAEEAWNENQTAGQKALLGSGGGASLLFSKPAWQALPGVPHDQARDIPDLSLNAGVNHDGYVFCSSDQDAGVTTNCSEGFLDVTKTNLSVAGGTSFGAPILAGVAALMNQITGARGLGNLNPRLYALALTAPNGFHDITTGDNKQPCMAGSKDCPIGGSIGYSAGIGYDQVTGLGTPDVQRLLSAIVEAEDATASVVELSLHQLDGLVAAGKVTHVLAAVSGPPGALNGTIEFAVDGSIASPATPLEAGRADFPFSSSVAGQHTLTATVTDVSGHVAASKSIVIEVEKGLAPPEAPFTLTSSPDSWPGNYETTSTITVTPIGAYSGQVEFSAGATDPYLIRFGCYSILSAHALENKAVQATLLLARSTAACDALSSSQGKPAKKFIALDTATLTSNTGRGSSIPQSSKMSFASSLIEACGVLFLSKVAKKIRCCAASVIGTCAIVTFCSGCGVVTTAGEAKPGAYTIVLTGSDTNNAAKSASISIPFQLH